MEYLRKYATATHIYIPIIKRAVVDFAVSADWTPAAGDVKISIDGGAAANVTNLPTAITMGNGAKWDFSLTTGELTGKKIDITVVDAATKAVEDQMFSIITFGNASAEYPVDFSDAVAFGLSRLDTTVSSRMATFTLPTNFASLSIDVSGRIDVIKVNGTSQTARDLGAQLDAAVSSRMATFTLPTNFSSLAIDVSGRVDLSKVLGAAINALISGRIDANTQIIANAAIASATFAANALDSAALATSAAQEIADAFLDRTDAIETGITPRGLLRLIGAALAGVLAGAATTTVTISNIGNTKTRITATVDVNGNRSVIVTDVT